MISSSLNVFSEFKYTNSKVLDNGLSGDRMQTEPEIHGREGSYFRESLQSSYADRVRQYDKLYA